MEGLPLVLYIKSIALGFVASAPSPYTVSVGKATKPPDFIISEALLTPTSSFDRISVFLF